MNEDRLRRIAPFAGLSTGERRMLARVVDELSVPAGATLVREGDYGYEFMVIEEGTVDVFRDGARIDSMGPGDFFGELAVLDDGGLRNATIVASSPARLITLTAHYLRVVRETMPQVAEQIEAVIGERRH